MTPSPIAGSPAAAPRRGLLRAGLAIAGIATVATILRAWNLGELSFWYDEVVTMRLASSPSPAALLRRLFEIDATRAPLHPLLLQGWLALLGSSETAARALSVVCGVLTVGLVAWIGLLVDNPSTGLWAAWLSACSPLLIYYAREARMYAFLVLLTCVSWGCFFALGKKRTTPLLVLYGLSLTALLYTHPLGMLMVATLGLASVLFARRHFGSLRRALAVNLCGLAPSVPWLPHYFDHPPEFLSGRLSIPYLLGTPIGFIGGNFAVLGGLLLLVAFGIHRRYAAPPEDRSEPVSLILWLAVPPVVLYAYSWIGHPVFGPARYTLYVAPAYLILVAQGLSRVRPFLRGSICLALLALASLEMWQKVYPHDLKADWRSCAQNISMEVATHPRWRHTVLVLSPGSGPRVEVETARYYLPEGCAALDYEEATAEQSALPEGIVYLAFCTRIDPNLSALPGGIRLPQGMFTVRSFPGLMLYRIWGELRDPPPVHRKPGATAGSDPR
jgi:4-amino-4-deoxy-L-arabinose transferase-like glycosyltransferase